MILQPVEHLFDILLKQSQCQRLVQSHFFRVPFILQRAMVTENLVDDSEHMRCTFAVIGGWIGTFEATHAVFLCTTNKMKTI